MAITIDGTTGIVSVNGSAGSPSVRGTDANSGVVYGSDTIKCSRGGVDRATIDNSGLKSTGHILQVVQTVKTDTDSTDVGPGNEADLGISCAITPKSASNKILIDCNLMIASSTSFGTYLYLVRGSTKILLGDVAGNRTRASKYISNYTELPGNTFPSNAYNVGESNIKYLDSPTYSVGETITYKIQAAGWNSSKVYINRCHNDNDAATFDGRGTSTIILMEVAG